MSYAEADETADMKGVDVLDGDGGVMYGHWGNFDLSKGTKGKV